MNSLMLKAVPWVLCGLLILGLLGMTHLYQSERDARMKFEGAVVALGEQAKVTKERIETEQAVAFETIRSNYEKNLPAVRNDAVAAFRLRYPSSCGGRVSSPALGQSVDDGASKEQLDVIANCGDDANKLEAWQSWATLNHIPVKE